MKMSLNLFIISTLVISLLTQAFAEEDKIQIQKKTSYRICFELYEDLVCSEETGTWSPREIELVTPTPPEKYGSEENQVRSYMIGSMVEDVKYQGHTFKARIIIKKFTDGQSPQYQVKLSTENTDKIHRTFINTDSIDTLNEVRLSGNTIPSEGFLLIPSLTIRPY